MSYVFQRPNILEWKTVEENVLLPYAIKRHVTDEVRQRAKNLLTLIGLDMKKDRFPDELSGGERARVAIARALITNPSLLLMDEPTSALDPISTNKIEELVHELKEKYTVVIVTHNMQQAARISDKTAFFLNGEVIEFGDTEQIFGFPVDKRTDDYISGRFG